MTIFGFWDRERDSATFGGSYSCSEEGSFNTDAGLVIFFFRSIYSMVSFILCGDC